MLTLERKNNLVKFGSITVEIPPSISALNLMGTGERNQWKDGDTILDNGWVKDTQGNYRKWFTLFDNEFYLWEPKLNDLALCEAKRWQAYLKTQDFHQKNWQKVHDNIPNEKFCGFFNNGPHANGYVEFTPTENGASWNWCENRHLQPNLPLNQNACDLYFAYTERAMQMGNRLYMFNQVFRQAVDRQFSKYFNATITQQIQAIINDRVYWLTNDSEYARFNVYIFAYPEKIFTVKVA